MATKSSLTASAFTGRLALIISVTLHAVIIGTLAILAGPDSTPKRSTATPTLERPPIRWVRSEQRRVEEPVADPVEGAAASRESSVSLTAFEPLPEAPRRSHPRRANQTEPTLTRPVAPELAATTTVEPVHARPTSSTTRFALPETSPPASAIQRPTLLSRVAPVYPQSCIDAEHEGVVLLLLSIDTVGKVTWAEIIEPSCCEELDKAAHKAALELEYKPATRNGRAVVGATTIKIRFLLEK